MENLYDELKKLCKMENAREDWADYRDNLTKIITGDTVKRTNVMIIGVGDCNDLDLKILSDHFDLICLADRSLPDVPGLCDKYNIDTKKRKNIFGRTIDLIGISDNTYRKIADEIASFMQRDKELPQISDLADYVIKKYADMYENAVPDFSETDAGYDYVIISGVYSQLFNMPAMMWDVFSEQYNDDDGDSAMVYHEISKITDKKIPSVNDYLLKISKRGLITVNEAKRVGRRGAVEGAYQFFKDIQRRLDEGLLDIKTSEKLLWPFDVTQSKLYEMSYIHLINS